MVSVLCRRVGQVETVTLHSAGRVTAVDRAESPETHRTLGGVHVMLIGTVRDFECQNMMQSLLHVKFDDILDAEGDPLEIESWG